MTPSEVERADTDVKVDSLPDRQRQIILGQLAPIIVHEFNNLMTPVLARAQDAVDRQDVAAMRKALTVTARQTERAMKFARRVLELAGGDGEAPQACSVRELIDATVESAVRPFEKDGIELRVDAAADLRIVANPLLFVQLLLNLLLNARAAVEKRRGSITIRALQETDRVVISVSDTGVGISPDVLRDAITPFLAASPDSNPGDWRPIGLGLQACRQIAHRQGAVLRARANDGSGCTFEVSWPAG